MNKRVSSSDLYTLHCEWCHRTVGNWNFQNEEDTEPQLKRQKTSETEKPLPLFEAFTQHHRFCPWAYSIDGETSAWEQVLNFYSITSQETSLSLQVSQIDVDHLQTSLTVFLNKAEEGFKKLVMALN